MTHITDTVIAIGELTHKGNLVDTTWMHWLKVFNGGKTSGVIPIAALLLGDIVYWYRPTEIRDEKTGILKGVKAKFAADKLQRSYNAIADQLAITKTQAKNAVKMLEDAGAITVEFRTITVRGTCLNNVMFLEPQPEIIALWQAMPCDEDRNPNNNLIDEYFSLCAKLLTGMRQKSHRSEQFNQEVLAKSPRRIQRLPQDFTEISTEDSVYTKSVSGEHADTGESNFENSLANDELEGKHSGVASPKDQKQDSGGGENDSHSQNPYFAPWDTSTAFREDKDGWAVIPQFPKHKMANFIATRAMQLELLQELDSEFTIAWESSYDRQCYITTTHAGEGFEDRVLGTKKSNGMTKGEWAIEDDDDEDIYCVPGEASLRLLRDWGYNDGAFSQETYNSRLKELGDEARIFLERDNAMVIFSTCPIYEYMDLDGIEMADSCF